jgi:hypothetical protein
VEALDCGCVLGDVVLEINGTVVLNQPQAIATVRHVLLLLLLLLLLLRAWLPPLLLVDAPQIQEEVSSAIAEGYPLVKLKVHTRTEKAL